jgi:hypothetical protein
MEFHIGTNVWQNATGLIISVGGKPQVMLETGADGHLLLTADLYNRQGEHVGKLNRNAWVFAKSEDYVVTTQPSSMTLRHTRDNSVLFAVQRISPDKIQVHPCQFYTPTGISCVVTDSSFKIGDAFELSGNTVVGSGGFVMIDDSRKGIGIS